MILVNPFQVEGAVMHLLPSLDKKLMGVEGLRIYLLLHELLHAIQKHKQQQSTKLAEAIAAAVLRLSTDSLQILGTVTTTPTPCASVQMLKLKLDVVHPG